MARPVSRYSRTPGSSWRTGGCAASRGWIPSTASPWRSSTPPESGIDLVDDGLDAFDHLNAALCPDPLLITVAPSAVVDQPLQVTSISEAPGMIGAPRVIVDMGENSELTVISWSTSDDRARLGVPRVILRLGQASRLTWIEVQDLGSASVSLGRQVATIGRDAQLSVTAAALGGSSARMRFDTVLEGRGSSARLDVLYYGDGDQHHDLRTFPTHLGADTTSLLDFRGALDDSATAVYTGLVRIAEEARGTNAEQSNRIIKLSENAWAESVPNLEIHNNDVRCSHASAVGPIDADQRFYLESRGVPPQRAEQLVVSGFFADLVARTALPTLVDAVTERIVSRWEVSVVSESVRLCALDDLVDGEAARFEVGGTAVAVVRLGDDVYAIGADCTHQDVDLTGGEVVPDDCSLECPQHGAGFSLETGRALSLPATRDVPVYEVTVTGNDVSGEHDMSDDTTSHELVVTDLHVEVGGTEILKGVDLVVRSGEVHAIMGPNGSGKSTLGYALMGHPGYVVTAGSVTLDGDDLLSAEPYERAARGLFLAQQYPVEVPGVALVDVVDASLRTGATSEEIAELVGARRIGWDSTGRSSSVR